MTQTVADLEGVGYVARRPDPDDRRRAIVELTAAGDAALAEERRLREGWLAKAISEDLTPEQQAVLKDAAELLRLLAESG